MNGADATFAATTVVATGGAGGVAASAATSVGGTGSTTGGVGDTVFAGGSGGTGVSSTISAGGGSGAGTTGTGNAGSGQTAGVAKANNGGAGGTGVSVANTRNAGAIYGGGGSGGLSSSGTDRAGGNGAQGLAVLTYTTPLTSALTDNFTTKDTAKWSWGGTSAVSSGTLTQTPTSGYTDYIITPVNYSLVGSSISVQLVQPPNVGNGGTEALLAYDQGGGNSEVLTWNNGNLNFRETVANVQDNTSLTYSATDHKYLRIRESGGTIYWDTSDGVTWTNRRNKVAGISITSGTAFLQTGYVATEPSPGTTIWDNFNLSPPVGKLVSVRQAVNRASTY